MILDNLIWTPVYLIYSRTINTHYCSFTIVPPVLCFFCNLIVLIVRTSYSLYKGSYCSPFTYCFQLQTLFCLACNTHTLLSGHRTIARSCINSVACTPWSISSLNCCTRLVVYLLSNEISSLNCCTRYSLLLTCLTPHLCALTTHSS